MKTETIQRGQKTPLVVFAISIVRASALIVLASASYVRSVGALPVPQTPQRPSAQRSAPLPTANAQGAGSATPQLKAIFEPVNYNQDLHLLDAFFVSAREGWVSGVAGTILHTVDGGKTWTAQLGGDPQGQGPNITRLFFLDRTHGWAETGNQLFRTTDGENWQQVGSDVRGHVVFTSPTQGFRGYGDKIYQTLDGGATWKEIYTCAGRTTVQGLTQQFTCNVLAIQFVTPRVAYGVGENNAVLGGGVVVKSEDGGATWNVIFVPQESGDQRTSTVFFLDENRGFVLRNSGMYRTTDGGKSWQGVVATIPGGDTVLKFADPDIGWSLVQLPASYTTAGMSYTADGGGHWLSRNLNFPAPVSGFSLPRRNIAYVVGDHGMVYRYRVVPAAYSVPNVIAAPLMPAFDATLADEFTTINSVIAKLRAQLPAAAATASAGPSGGFQQDASAATNNGAATQGGFQQDTSSLNNGGVTAQGGFPQATGATVGAPGYLDSCCTPLLQQLDSSTNLFATDFPVFTQRYRSLNLIFEGLAFATRAVSQAQMLKQSVSALHRAPNAQAASGALNTVSSQLNGISTASGGFQQNTTFP